MDSMDGVTFSATHDPEAHATYIKFFDTPVARTSQFRNVNIDIDSNERVVGIEILSD